MTGITPSPENFRAEIARHQLTRPLIAELLGMHVNSVSNYVCGYREPAPWLNHNIGYAINRLTGIRIFEVEMGRGILPAQRALPNARVRDPRRGSVLPTPPRRRRRRKTTV